MRGEYLEHRRMVEAGGDRVLALEGGQHTVVGRGCGRRHLEGDFDSASIVVRAPPLTLAARTQFFEQREAGIEPTSVNRRSSLCHDLMGPGGTVQVPVLDICVRVSHGE